MRVLQQCKRLGLLTWCARLPMGYTSSLATLRREFVERKGYSESALNRALQVMSRKESVQFRRGGALVHRSGV